MTGDSRKPGKPAQNNTTVRCTVPDDVARLLFGTGDSEPSGGSAGSAGSVPSSFSDGGAAAPVLQEPSGDELPLFLSVEVPADAAEPTSRSRTSPVESGVSELAQSVAGGEGAAESAGARVLAIAALANPERYQDLDLLGRGGMGVVRRVIDRVLGREAAMKAIDGPFRSVDVLRFLEEAQITGQLDHPSIVPIHDFGVTDAGSRAYFTMKLVRGDTLSRTISLHHAIGLEGRALERLLGIFLRVCEGVSFAHARRVVHRDLKPDNVLVGSHGQVYVMDWGLARVVDGGRPSEKKARSEHHIAGTPSFMAPEQAQGRVSDIDARTDVFGLGGILYAILTGNGPFHSASSIQSLELARKGVVHPPQGPAQRTIPPELTRIVMKALAAAPTERYQTAEHLAHDVEEFLRGGGWFGTRSFEAGSIIVQEGEPGSAAYVITEGRCEVYKTFNGVKIPLRTMGPGEVFGETAVFTAKPRTATVAALEPVTVKVVTRDSLERELDRNPWMGAFVRALAERFREVDEKLSQRAPTSGPMSESSADRLARGENDDDATR